MYVSSDKIKFYPSAYRYYMDDGVSVVIDQEASKNTEFNLTSHLSKVFHLNKGSFIVSDDNATDLEFYIGGYYAKVDNVATSLLASSDWSSALNIYANVKTVLTTPSGGEPWENLYEVVQFEDLYKPLDDKINASDIVFKGIKFGTAVDPNATFSLHLYTRASTSDSFTLVANSKYPLSLTALLGNPTNGKSASEEIKTASLLVTNTVSANAFSGVNATLTGTLNSNKGVFNTVEVDTSILPRTGSIAVLGSGDRKFDQLYTSEAHLDDIYTSYVEVGALWGTGGTNPIKLGNNLIPNDAYTQLGTSSNRFRTIYANDIYGDLNGTAEEASALVGTYGSSTAPVYIDDGIPTTTVWNSSFYNKIDDTLMFKNVKTYYPNAATFYAYFGNATTSSYIYLSLFLTIEWSYGERSTLNFVCNSPNPSSKVSTTTEVLSFGNTYRCQINGPYKPGNETRVQVTLQYYDSGGWSTVSEKIETAVIYYYIK